MRHITDMVNAKLAKLLSPSHRPALQQLTVAEILSLSLGELIVTLPPVFILIEK